MFIKFDMNCEAEYLNLDYIQYIEFNEKDTIKAWTKDEEDYIEIFSGTEEECRNALRGLEEAMYTGATFFNISVYWSARNHSEGEKKERL